MATAILDTKRVEKIETDAVRQTINKIAEYLQRTLGQKMTAYLSGLKNPKEVGSWAAGDIMPRDKAQLRLRHAYKAARMLTDAYDAETTKAWFFGTNTRLDDEAPAYILRYAETPDDLRSVAPAARAFAGLAE